MTRDARVSAWPLVVKLVASLGIGLAAVASAQTMTAPVFKDPKQPIERRIDDLLSRMTLEEKAAQLITIWEHKGKIQAPDGTFASDKAVAEFRNGLGQIARPSDSRGITQSNGAAGAAAGAFGRDARNTAEYVNAAQRWATQHTRLGIPILMHEEALHGYVARGATSFPQAIGLASTWNPTLVEKVFSVAAREMRGRGATLALAPVVDIARDPRWGRIEETYGEDPYLTGEMGLAAIRGFQGRSLPVAPNKVLVTLKHLTGHGQPESGTNTGPAALGERELRTNFFPPFEKAVKQGNVLSVMPSYNEIDGIPSHANRWLLTDVLRGEWGFKGATVSDYFAIREMVGRHRMFTSIEEASIRAMDAGVDSETPDGEAYALLPKLVRAGRVSQKQVDEAVRRMLRLKFQLGLFENPYADSAAAFSKEATPDAIALARQSAREAMVLLKNQNNLLPLNPAALKRVAVLGTHARDTPIGGYSDMPRHVVSVLEGIQKASRGRFTVDYSEGVRITETRVWAKDDVKLIAAEVNRGLIANAVRTARRADAIVVVLGDNEETSREAWSDGHLGDRSSLDLIGEQNELARAVLALGKPTVFVLLNGRPLSINYLAENAAAIVEGWYLGQETGNAVADVLFGDYNPGGKLPVTIARHVGQLPMFYNRKPTARRGYLFDTTAPLYPFGYGLSYTSFDISAPRFIRSSIRKNQTAQVSVDVANTGNRAGDEVVQLYVRDDASSVTRPVIELKGFQRVTLRPGEQRTIHFTLGTDELSLWNVNMDRVVEPGTFTVSAGPNSVQLKSATLTVID